MDRILKFVNKVEIKKMPLKMKSNGCCFLFCFVLTKDGLFVSFLGRIYRFHDGWQFTLAISDVVRGSTECVFIFLFPLL